jgi:hypothetical protein
MNFENLKMKESDSVDQYMTQAINVINQLMMNSKEIPYQRHETPC